MTIATAQRACRALYLLSFSLGGVLACGGSGSSSSANGATASNGASSFAESTTTATTIATGGATSSAENGSTTNQRASHTSTGGAGSTAGLASGSAQGGSGNGSGSSTDGSVGSTSSTSGGGGANTGEPTAPTYVYVGSGNFTNELGMITVYSLDRASKMLTFVSEHPAGGMAIDLVIDTARDRLFSADPIYGGVQSFAIDRATGMLTSLGATTNDGHPLFLSMTADGQYLLAANNTERSLDVYPIDGTGKATDRLSATANGFEVRSVVVDDQNRVFAAAVNSNYIAPFEFSSGTLTLGAFLTDFDAPGEMFATSEKLYVISEEADRVASFFVFDDGFLALDWEGPRLGSSTGDGADIEVTPSGKYLYATNLDPENSIVAYDISGSEPVYLGHESSRGGSPVDCAIDPAEELVIVSNVTSPATLEVFSIQPDGTLQHERTEGTTVTPFSVGIAQF